MYPLLLKPATQDYLWGGDKLKKEFNIISKNDCIAEAWMLSNREFDENVVLNGEFKGKLLSEVLEIWGSKALGCKSKEFKDFPVLIKLIDANQKLSIQVHPDDEYAFNSCGESGKTEVWYVLDCKKGAELIYGFNKDVTKEELEQRIKDNTITEICNFVPVKKGDMFFIEPGTVHAIGDGILIAEIQQNSNITYRLFDYGRLDNNGKPRELHIKNALDVINLARTAVSRKEGDIYSTTYYSLENIVECKYFTTKLLITHNRYSVLKKKTFVSFVVLDKNVNTFFEDGMLELKKGDSVFVPAGCEVTFRGNAELLMTYIE